MITDFSDFAKGYLDFLFPGVMQSSIEACQDAIFLVFACADNKGLVEAGVSVPARAARPTKSGCACSSATCCSTGALYITAHNAWCRCSRLINGRASQACATVHGGPSNNTLNFFTKSSWSSTLISC